MCTCLEYPCSPALNEFAVEKKHDRRVNLDDIKDDAEEEVCHTFMLHVRVVTASQDKSEASEAGSQAAEEDYDVEEEYDNDYADDYFDNGEGDDLEDLGGGGAGDPSGGGALVSFIDLNTD
jgi:DNA-directed RNA polymerase III subunit RPC7